jgi:DNA-directed RNA polymerase specialized sigma24 family protein
VALHQQRPWTLTRDALASLLKFLDEDAERAAVEYERVRARLTKLFRWRGCLAADNYTDVTVDRVARMLVRGDAINTASPYALFYGVAMKLLQEHWRQVKRERQAIAEARQTAGTTGSIEEQLARHDAERLDEQRRRCLRRCLMRLSPDSRALITRYYAGKGELDKNQRKAVAAELRISVNALRVRAHRVRNEVGDCVAGCLQREAAVK